MDNETEFWDVEQAAAQLGIKKATLYAYVSRGLLQSYKQKVGRKRLYRRDDIVALCAVEPSQKLAEATEPEGNDGVQRNVRLPEAASWAGDH